MKTLRMAVISAELYFVSQKDIRGKIYFAFVCHWVLHPSATLASALLHIIHHSDGCTDTQKHSRTQIASRKLHHFPVVWKLHLSLTIPPITPQVSFFLSSPLPLSPALLHYFSLFPPLKLGPKLPGLNCPMNSVGWTGRQEVCVNAWVSLLSPSLFIFLSKWCCQEPNKISLSALPRQGVYTQHLGKEIKERKKKGRKKTR